MMTCAPSGATPLGETPRLTSVRSWPRSITSGDAADEMSPVPPMNSTRMGVLLESGRAPARLSNRFENARLPHPPSALTPVGDSRGHPVPGDLHRSTPEAPVLPEGALEPGTIGRPHPLPGCLLYTSDAADDLLCVDL